VGEPTRSAKLFGTDEPVAPPLLLQAGPLSAELEDGNLRYIRFLGREMLRAVSFIVRDPNWATYRPKLSNLRAEQGADVFRVSYEALAGDSKQSFRYVATIEGRADGSLVFRGDGEAVTAFETNRTGFVVLHPIDGVSGAACTIEHVDGRCVDGRFPDLIDPVQPMMALRALTHEFAPGYRVTCRMEGDTFEMEDQRNWTDASYKTYVRPLALPWPYTLDRGTRLQQRVSLTVSAAAHARLAPRDDRIVLSLEPSQRRMPRLGFGIEPQDLAATLEAAPLLRDARPAHVVISHDPRRGHSLAALAQAIELARRVGAEPWLEAVVARLESYDDELAELGKIADQLGAPFTTVLVSPAPDLKCTLPGSPWPPCPPLAGVYRAARAAFPKAAIGGGMFSYFTELNRKRPPLDLLDLVTFTTSAVVHAGDDRSVTETLESLPSVAGSLRAMIGEKPYHVGPSAIGMRANPYGAAPMENPDQVRQAMSRADPRQRGLLGAAWAAGYVARFARGGASAITLGGGTGDFGLVNGTGPQRFYPAFHVFKGLAALAGATQIDAVSSAPRQVQAVSAVVGGAPQLWIANLTGEVRSVVLPSPSFARCAVLDEASFAAASRDANALDTVEIAPASATIELGPYAVARLRGTG
jgi:hypothetical protein